MKTFNLPELGEGLSEGEVVAWHVKEGDAIKADQTMVEVMTDKATVQVPSPVSGIVKKLYYKPGDLAKVGKPLIDIASEGAQSEAKAPREEKAESPKTVKEESERPAPAPAASARAAASREVTRVLASPAVRRLARDLGVDLQQVQGTGDRGRVLRADLQTRPNNVPARPAVRALEERIPFIGVRRKIAEHLSHSKFTAVHFTHFEEVDFSEIIRMRNEANQYAEKNGLTRLSYLPFFIKGSIAALKKFPILNSSLDTQTNEIVVKHYYHFGISVQTDNGLMVAVVRDCDQKNIFELAKEIKEVADRARSGKASVQDLAGSTITITNPGNIGGLYATPVINYPETVILGMFQIKKRPVVVEVDGRDEIVARPMMFTNITCDHRIIDGAVAAGYLRLFCEYMENPARMAFM